MWGSWLQLKTLVLDVQKAHDHIEAETVRLCMGQVYP